MEKVSMQKAHTVHVTEVLAAPIDKVWKYLREYNELPAFHPAIKASRIEKGVVDEVGCIRYLTLEAGFVREELLMLDDNTYALDYTIIESSLPLENYVAGIRLKSNPNEDKTICEWWADFDVPADIDKNEMIEIVGQNVFRAGFLALARKLEKQTSVSYH